MEFSGVMYDLTINASRLGNLVISQVHGQSDVLNS